MKHDFLSPKSAPKGIGNNLYLLGTSNEGPYMNPVYIRDPAEARRIFGDEDKGNLVRAFDQAYARNKNISIYLMRITGKSATLDIGGILSPDWDTKEKIPCMLQLWTTDAGEKYNTYWIEVQQSDDGDFFLIHTDKDICSYDITDEELTCEGLIQRINNDCRKGIHNILAATDHPNEHLWFLKATLLDSPHEFMYGEDGLDATKNDLYIACDLAYTILLGRNVDIVVPVGMYVDDVHPAYLYGDGVYGSAFYSANIDYLKLVDTHNGNRIVSYHEQLIDFCREQIKLGYMTHGVIGMRPLAKVPKNIEHDNSYIQGIVEASAFRDRRGFLESSHGVWIDKGFYISVVAHELIFHSGNYYDNGAVRYASILSGHYDSTTRLPIGDDVSLRYELSDQTRYELSRMGIVTFRDSPRHGLVVSSGVSAAVEKNDYHNVANVRMTQLTIAYMNDAVQSVYSKEIAPEARRMMVEELVKKRLADLTEHKVLTGYDYEIQFTQDESQGQIILTLQTKYSVEGIAAVAEIVQPE